MRGNETPYVLSNWHVLNGPKETIGDDIVHSPHDDNRTHLNRLGKLIKSHLGHAEDCVVVTIDGHDVVPDIIDLGIVLEKIGEPELFDKVLKSERTTGITHATVNRVLTIIKFVDERLFG